VPGVTEDFPAIPDPPPAEPPGLPVRGPGWQRRLAILAVALVGIAGLAGGGPALHAELTRHATASEVAAAGRTEIATRWRRWPAGQIFPAAAGFGGRVTSGPSFGNVSGDSPASGTAVASAIAGSGPSAQNPSGTLGLAPQARILSLRVPGAAAAGRWQADDAEAIRYAARHRARVILVDLLGNDDDLLLDSAVQYAETRHAVVISDEFPFGKSRNAAEYPASLPGVLGAGATILPGWPVPPRRSASPANDSILVAAPGTQLAPGSASSTRWARCTSPRHWPSSRSWRCPGRR
jgi:hypothetical protein